MFAPTSSRRTLSVSIRSSMLIVAPLHNANGQSSTGCSTGRQLLRLSSESGMQPNDSVTNVLYDPNTSFEQVSKFIR